MINRVRKFINSKRNRLINQGYFSDTRFLHVENTKSRLILKKNTKSKVNGDHNVFEFKVGTNLEKEVDLRVMLELYLE